MHWAMRSPPGTSIGPFMIVPPFAVTRLRGAVGTVDGYAYCSQLAARLCSGVLNIPPS